MPIVISGTNGISGVDGTASNPSYEGTDANTGVFFPAADTVAIATGGTEALRVNSSQNVGIGTTNPFQRLEVRGGQAQFSNGGDLYINSTGTAVNLYGANNVPMIFYTNGNERARFNAGAPILCLSGGNTSATGTGIAFPATQSASSDANTLDDYEEGSWTPGVAFNGATTGLTYASRVGTYSKVGNTVSATFDITLSSKGSSTGAASITGLPFAAIAGQPYITFLQSDFLTFSAVTLLYITAGSTSVLAYQGASGSVSAALTNTNFANNTTVRATIVYQTST